MFKKIVKVISVAAVLAVSANAMNFCKTADSLFLQDGLEKGFFEYNNKQKLGEVCEGDAGSATCVGEMKAYETLANNLFNAVGYENVITLLNKYGVKRQYNKTQIYMNYNNFFLGYLKNKIQDMNEAKRKIFLEKMFLFFNRVPDEIVKYNDKQLTELSTQLALLKIFEIPLFEKITDKNRNAAKELIKLGATAFLANTKQKGVNSIKGEVILAFHPAINMQYSTLTYDNKQGFSSKDPQLGGGADNIREFFVYAATKQYQKAFNLINNTYSDQLVKELNKEIKEVCNIK